MLFNQQSSEFAYEEVEIAHLDPEMRMRTLMRGMLLTNGFRKIHECRTVDDLTHLLANNPVDLLVLDLDADLDKLCKLVRQIREDELDADPYLVIMALTWNPEQALVARTLQSGMDDVIAKPISPKVFAQRTANLIRNRKEFIVTSGYVGPDRRGPDREEIEELPTIKVPNSLRYKATGDQGAVADPVRLAQTRREIKKHRVYRLAAKISAEALKLEKQVGTRRNEDIAKWQYRDMTRQVAEINQMITKERLTDLTPIGESMGTVIKAIADTERPTERQLAVLRLHSQAIGATIKDPEGAADLITVALSRAAQIIGKKKPAGSAAA